MNTQDMIHSGQYFMKVNTKNCFQDNDGKHDHFKVIESAQILVGLRPVSIKGKQASYGVYHDVDLNWLCERINEYYKNLNEYYMNQTNQPERQVAKIWTKGIPPTNANDRQREEIFPPNYSRS